MTCDEARPHLLDHRRRRLDPAAGAELRVHLRACEACGRADAAEALLDEVLTRRLPRHAAPTSLKRRLRMLTAPGRERTGRRTAWARIAAPALAAGVALFAGGLVAGRSLRRDAGALDALATEAVGDHLRVLVREHPLDVQSGGSHEVKPWFAGRLDFAPAVPELEGSALSLQGGAVSWFLDRRAAAIEYALRKHRVTLLVFRDEGLAWPAGAPRRVGGLELRSASLRGFHVVLWRAGGLGHALVSDANLEELEGLAVKLAAAS